MANRLFQSIVYQMRGSIDRVIGVIDDMGIVVACSELSKVGICNEALIGKFKDIHSHFMCEGNAYQPFGNDMAPEYAVFVEGNDDLAVKFAKLLAISFMNIQQYYDENFDRTNFIKNVVLDNILPSDIYVKSKELHFDSELSYVAFYICIESNKDTLAFETVQSLFPDKQKDFVFTISDNEMVLIKNINESIQNKDLEKLAASIIDTLGGSFYARTRVGIGTKVIGIKELARSFKEARIALEVGKVFNEDKGVVSYNKLGIARLIYQLPITLCETYLREVFIKGTIESLDQETLFTINKFFENNLNVSETSRKLFIHRNTLVYRLDKIHKLTGLDLREFDQAIVFKIALMVKKYLDMKS